MVGRTAVAAPLAGARAARIRRADVVALLAVLLTGVAATSTFWVDRVNWSDPDSLYYQARTLELRGAGENQAISTVFDGPLRRQGQHEGASPNTQRRMSDPQWIDYTKRFFRRRVFVPALAAAVYPVFGERSLLVVSLVGYLVFGAAMFALLRKRFDARVSGIVSVLCMLCPIVRRYAEVPMTDSWGLALEAAGLLAGVAVLERGRRAVVPWVAAVAALSFTRDAGIVLVVAALVLALRRVRHAALLALTGVAAALPAYLLYPVPLRSQLAYVMNDYEVPQRTDWSWILAHLPHAAWGVVRGDAIYSLGHPRHLIHSPDLIYAFGTPVTVLLALAGLVALYRRTPLDDLFFRFLRAAPAGCLVFLAVALNFQRLRLELVLLPVAAVGLATLAARWKPVR